MLRQNQNLSEVMIPPVGRVPRAVPYDSAGFSLRGEDRGDPGLWKMGDHRHIWSLFTVPSQISPSGNPVCDGTDTKSRNWPQSLDADGFSNKEVKGAVPGIFPVTFHGWFVVVIPREEALDKDGVCCNSLFREQSHLSGHSVCASDRKGRDRPHCSP